MTVIFKKLWPLLCLVAYSTSAEAKQVLAFCTPLIEIDNAVEDCTKNHLYSEQAIDCLNDMEKAIQTAVAQLNKDLDTAKKNSAQNKTLSSSTGNYFLSEKKLNLLLSRAIASSNEIKAYKENVVLPEDHDSELLKSEEDFENFINGVSCFSDNHQVLEYVLEDFDEIIKDLTMARDASLLKKTDSNSREADMDGGTVIKNAGSNSKITVPTPTKRGDPIRESDISGTEKLQKK
jgi:hypothetical protein